MKTWDLSTLEVQPRKPRILSSSDDARAIVLYLPEGERLEDHEVHERAWVLIVSGEVEITTADDHHAEGGPGMLVEFDPRERHEVRALSDARFLLLLTPWPGKGHPHTLTLEEKAEVRTRATEHRAS